LIFALSLVALLACQSGAAGKPAVAKAPRLQYQNGQLSFLSDGQTHPLQSKAPLPYQIVASSDAYSLVTTADAALAVATYSTDGVNVRRFPDMLPQVVQPPVCALFGLADSAADGATGMVLLGSRGEQVWRGQSADLLWPATGAPRRDVFCIAAGTDTNPLGIYGLQPALVRVNAASGAVLWRQPIPTDEYVEDAVVYGIGAKHGLLCLQYGTDLFEFFRFDVASGAMQTVYTLDGTPTYQNVYPGPIAEPLGVQLSGDSLQVTVTRVAGGWHQFTFDLAKGTVMMAKAQPQPLLSARNPHPNGGSGAAKPPLFPQGIVPTQSGASWTIPALVNAKGQVFVTTADGANWVTP
jgi:hypothetical protein